MRILHYTLGLPPFRSGGMTKYALDLMSAQSKEDDVFLLYPGRMLLFSQYRKIQNKPSFGDIRLFELCNPMLVPLLYGVSDPDDILKDARPFSPGQLEAFYQTTRPDVFHIHTLMGLPKELIQYLKQKDVSIVYTSHDYYGICSKVNLVDNMGRICDVSSCKYCEQCNAASPSARFLRMRNSDILLRCKNNKFLRKLILK